MSNGFGFGPPPSGFGAPPGQTPAGFGGPPPRAISAAEAMAGFNSDQIESRLPFLPVGCAVRFKVDAAYGKTSPMYPYAIYIEGTIEHVYTPGGGAEPSPGAWPEKANRMPAQVGARHAIRIDGFGNQKKDKFAREDVGNVLCALFEEQGVSKQWNPGPAGQDAWLKLIAATFPNFGEPTPSAAVGKSMLVETGVVRTDPTRNNGTSRAVSKVRFFPLSVAPK